MWIHILMRATPFGKFNAFFVRDRILSSLLWDEQLFLHQFSGLFWYPQQTGQDDLCCFTSPTHSAFTFAKESGGNHGEKEEENVCVCQTPPDQQCPKG